jgi:hypothetical protein
MFRIIKNHLDTLEHGKGNSSLFFIISFIISLIYSDLLLWKFANLLLPLISYLFNAYNKPEFQIIDHIAIAFVGCSYINISLINIIFFLILLYEYTIHKEVYRTMRLAFSSSILLAIYNTYYYNYGYFLLLLIAIIVAIPTYFARNYYYYKEIEKFSDFTNPHNYTSNDLTYLWHIGITCIISITSMTATIEMTSNAFLLLPIEVIIAVIYTGFLSTTYYGLYKRILEKFD